MSFTPRPWSPEIESMFIAGDFFDQPVPREKQYLLKYFKTKRQRQYVKYVIFFKSDRNFIDHSGIKFQFKWMLQLRVKLSALETAHTTAKKLFKTNVLALIEQGKYKARFHAAMLEKDDDEE